ncbi:uncharacterized protein LOC142987161 [Anticarsia gemmatalis]|uniref:uncharacterized protein LOC142987161 n=1 Tax=Anticarsia gemmatalis TaxID=129554 RepID=UPI003F75C1AC
MATLEDEIKDLKEKNNELAQKVQYWKMTAAERENDKLNLMKEMNELRLKLSRLRNTGGFEARKLDAALQQASEKAISHLVKASAEIAKSMEIAKAYIRDRQELDAQSPRWSTLGGTPTAEKTDKVHRVPPMNLGGQSIQPVVALSRTVLNTSNPRTGSRSPNQNRSLTERAVPMHMLQDVYIPLTRIDISDLPNRHMETDTDANNAENSAEELGLEDGEERLEESARMSEDEEEDDDEFSGRKLHALSEEESEIEEIETPRLTLHIDNPLEGPSWLLDSPPDSSSSNQRRGGANLEPDSTTELDRTPNTSCQKSDESAQKDSTGVSVRVSCEFSPTLRRRKRTSSPPHHTPRPHHYSPRPVSARKNSTSGRVLKVLVAKMRLEGEAEGTSPPKRARSPPRELLSFDAPSPNGATDSAVIVSESRTRLLDKEIKTEPATEPRESIGRRSRRTSAESRDSRSRLSQDNDQPRPMEAQETRIRTIGQENRETCDSRETRDSREVREGTSRVTHERESAQRSRIGSHDSRDSDGSSGGGGDSISEGRTRRPRKLITYKEKPLNRKLRR